MSKVRMIVQWALVALFAVCGLVWIPSPATVLFFLMAAILLPIKPVENFLSKLKLNFVVRIVIVVVLIVITAKVVASETPSVSQKNSEQNTSSSSDKKDDRKDTTKDDNKNNKWDNIKEDRQDSKSDSKNDSKNDKKDSGNDDDLKEQIIGTWHYGPSAALDMFYTFNEDGTWEMESENDATNNGTFEIVDGKTIKMKGSTEDRTFTIKNSDELTDEDGKELTRYVPDSDY